ncbi:hypothetical protein L1987_40631 [Smallanthus sonchifolius]|uniref:Uncharacterized protein n=1 Tax=Smallanthus sonchifolius TaxID=185202 RepID=A0ACB9GT55_9ASTR|nr:hypothetical protein L1987_40631 [Smallanthus sonchifolius]
MALVNDETMTTATDATDANPTLVEPTSTTTPSTTSSKRQPAQAPTTRHRMSKRTKITKDEPVIPRDIGLNPDEVDLQQQAMQQLLDDKKKDEEKKKAFEDERQQKVIAWKIEEINAKAME